MPRTPIPESLANAVGGLFSGPLWLILWRLAVIVGATLLAMWLLAVTSSFFVTVAVWVLFVFSIGALIKAISSDVWNFNFWSP